MSDYEPKYGDTVRLGKGRVLWEVGVVNDDIQLLNDRRREDNDRGITYRYIPVHESHRLTLVEPATGHAMSKTLCKHPATHMVSIYSRDESGSPWGRIVGEILTCTAHRDEGIEHVRQIGHTGDSPGLNVSVSMHASACGSIRLKDEVWPHEVLEFSELVQPPPTAVPGSPEWLIHVAEKIAKADRISKVSVVALAKRAADALRAALRAAATEREQHVDEIARLRAQLETEKARNDHTKTRLRRRIHRANRGRAALRATNRQETVS
ncbi:hypothetical protein [Nocardia fluminea]|uniref:hypothetical protein n=1 Tax=Nocardia fluminea TaxID=134984 RepID=UPI00364E49BB